MTFLQLRHLVNILKLYVFYEFKIITRNNKLLNRKKDKLKLFYFETRVILYVLQLNRIQNILN